MLKDTHIPQTHTKNPTNPQEIKAKGQAKPLKASLFYIILTVILTIAHIWIPKLKCKILSALKNFENKMKKKKEMDAFLDPILSIHVNTIF